MMTEKEFEAVKANDREAFRQWINRVTYSQAEKAYDDGVLSKDGWTCYRVMWALSAARFSSLADGAKILVHDACEKARA